MKLPKLFNLTLHIDTILFMIGISLLFYQVYIGTFFLGMAFAWDAQNQLSRLMFLIPKNRGGGGAV
jgi:hypothetical protein